MKATTIVKAINKRYVSPKTRFEVFRRDGFRCQYCGRHGGKNTQLEIDHLVPISKGGTNLFENLITACKECNIGKSKSVVIENPVQANKIHNEIYVQRNIVFELMHIEQKMKGFSVKSNGTPEGDTAIEDILNQMREWRTVINNIGIKRSMANLHIQKGT